MELEMPKTRKASQNIWEKTTNAMKTKIIT